MEVWLLIFWTGAREGYVTVPNLESEVECRRIIQVIAADKIGYSYFTRDNYHSCISYRVKAAR